MEDFNTSPENRLLSLTREMFACAQSGDWERLVDLEKTRLPLFKEIFAQGVSGKEELARQILSMDEKTIELTKAGMPVLKHELLSLRNSNKANDAYRSVRKLTSVDDR